MITYRQMMLGEKKRIDDSTIFNKILCTLIVLENMSARLFNMLNMIVTKL
ncbi:hypothetical protein AAEO50_14660 [Rossellomorea oryzaecorticis]|uniref:Uncharacterized protein n=1 Tax=Rossellomorea oryzaecorticis TaxID=1396505 RepID=A0ABU9KBX0_9BACI